MIYFISGHRDLSYEDFEKIYVPVLQKVIQEDLGAKFVVAECSGVDTMVQDWLALNFRFLERVTVFHMFQEPRHFASPRFNKKGGYDSDISRDAAMTEESDFDIAFVKDNRWTSGTAQNIMRRHNKK